MKVNTKVAVMGAAGGIGQPMSLLLKLNPRISQLALYDIVNTPGVAADLSHCSTPAKVTGYAGSEQLRECLDGAQVVVIPAGVPRKPGNGMHVILLLLGQAFSIRLYVNFNVMLKAKCCRFLSNAG